MSRRPNVSQTLALKAAAAAAAVRYDDDQDEAGASLAHTAPTHSPEPARDIELADVTEAAASPPLHKGQEPGPKATGRPKGRRSVAARQTVYLDDARHAALARLAEDRGRSIHSLILEGIDHVIGKPTAKGWQ
jgi:hypothetical protein